MAKRQDELKRLRDLSADELNEEGLRLKESLFRSRFKLSLGDNETVKTIRFERRQLARVQTIAKQHNQAAK